MSQVTDMSAAIQTILAEAQERIEAAIREQSRLDLNPGLTYQHAEDCDQRYAVTWTVDVWLPKGFSHRNAAEKCAELYFQKRIADGQPDTACVFSVRKVDGHGYHSIADVDLSAP